MTEKDDWFEEQSIGRIGITNWQGLGITVALAVVGIIGSGVDSALRRDHPILDMVLMVPLGALFLGLAWKMASRTKRR